MIGCPECHSVQTGVHKPECRHGTRKREIINRLRAAIANESISTMLIQTSDLEVLCDFADRPSDPWSSDMSKAPYWPNDGRLLQLLELAGYDTTKVHPDAYKNFGWRTFTGLLQKEVQSAPTEQPKPVSDNK